MTYSTLYREQGNGHDAHVEEELKGRVGHVLQGEEGEVVLGEKHEAGDGVPF